MQYWIARHGIPREAGPKARDAARKALALDQSDAEAHVALAIESQWYEWDWLLRNESSNELSNWIRTLAMLTDTIPGS